MQPQNSILKILLSLGLRYIRWTQLTPMILTWSFGLLMLLALIFVNFQEQTVSVVEVFLEWLMQLPVVGERITLLLTDENTTSQITSSDFESFVFSGWVVLSLVFMLIGMVVSLLFGPFRPWTLKGKILLAGTGVVLLLAGMCAIYFAVPQNFNGATSGWMLNFSLISLLVFVVSAYCLSAAHFLAYLDDALMTSRLNSSEDSGVI